MKTVGVLSASRPRELRVLFLASDGTSAGHLMRALAIARALRREAAAANVPLRALIATTSEAGALLAWGGVPAVRLPGPAAGGAAGWDEAARCRLAAGILRGVVDGFSPDLLVADTFPSGAHLEAAAAIGHVPRRVLVRRGVRAEAADEPAAKLGLDQYHLAIVPGELGETRAAWNGPASLVVRTVPPIVSLDADELLSREEARKELGLGSEPVALVTAGGGGDAEGRAAAERFAREIEAKGRFRAFLAAGPLHSGRPGSAVPPVPLARVLQAFDVAVAAAGYNTAHELAMAGIPAAWFALPRSYDDQAARADRFARSGFGCRLQSGESRHILQTLDRLAKAKPKRADTGGARAAARLLLEIATK